MIRFLISLLLLFAALPLPAAETRTELPAEDTFSDVNTGVIFPARLASFRKTEVRINPNPVIGTRIQYIGCQGKSSADIYIYALSEKPAQISETEFRQHCESMRQITLSLPRLSRRVEEVEPLRRGQFSEPGMIILREQFLTRTNDEETFHTELVLLQVGDRMVRLRLTVPAALTEEIRNADQFVTAFCRLFCRSEKPVFTFAETVKPADAPKK